MSGKRNCNRPATCKLPYFLACAFTVSLFYCDFYNILISPLRVFEKMVLEFGRGTGTTSLIHAPHVKHVITNDFPQI